MREAEVNSRREQAEKLAREEELVRRMEEIMAEIEPVRVKQLVRDDRDRTSWDSAVTS